MGISKLCLLGFYLNGALGSGKYDDISIDEVKSAIEDGSIFQFLEKRLGDDLDPSILDSSERSELMEEWASNVKNLDEREDCAVVRNGLCLLVAYLLQGIQARVTRSGANL